MAKRKKRKPYIKPNASNDNAPCRNYNRSMVMLLAYIHRYVFPIALGFLPLVVGAVFGKDYIFVLWGIAFILHGLYDVIGYKCKWRHIYCSFQNASHQKMTPDHVHWDDLKKSDIYGVAAFEGCLGIILIILSFFLLYSSLQNI